MPQHQGHNQRGSMKAKDPLLAKAKFGKKVKYRIVLIYFVLVMCSCVIGLFMVLKIDYDTVKLQKVTYDVIL